MLRRENAIRLRAYRERFIRALIMLAGITMVGTLGYHVIQDLSILDALYMTIITLSTVGYGEVGGDLEAAGQVFTILLIICSVGIVGYSVSILGSFILEGELNRIIQGRRMDKRIAGLKDHVIICGAGHTGCAIAEEFLNTKVPFVVIEKDEVSIQHLLQVGDVPYIKEDATEDESLHLARIKLARGLVTVMGTDKDNVFVVLSARSLNPKLRIVARMIEKENRAKLTTAGADDIVHPDAIGGMRMASLMIRPRVVGFLDTLLNYQGDLSMEEVEVEEGSPIAGRTLKDADISLKTGLLVVSTRSRDGEFKFNPGGDTRLNSGDTLLVMGTSEQLRSVESLLSPGARPR